MTSELRRHVHILFYLCDVMEKICFHARMGFYNSPKLSLANDIMHYLCFLIAADNKVTWEETAIVNEILDESNLKQVANSQELAEIVRDFVNDPFMQKIPESLKLFISFDLNAKAEKQFGNINYSVSELYVGVLRALGEEMIACDGQVDKSERETLQAYISRLISYTNNELKKDENNQNGGTVFIGGKA